MVDDLSLDDMLLPNIDDHLYNGNIFLSYTGLFKNSEIKTSPEMLMQGWKLDRPTLRVQRAPGRGLASALSSLSWDAQPPSKI